ncbi:FAD-dependent oxidoreductase [Flavivirga amylovorans]|uniref:FAD-dependent oxidoreductase n=1 Tax=Flavivirga amylovorans TaxID=870486 RepID=A0ABT8WWW4_9FLAO|nr:FAD-dependent oxidoreductase [Flavivirga amylovorans]MDO5986163.1 FAD-dependent oxidoreductase [Flavivirga amylovorans]
MKRRNFLRNVAGAAAATTIVPIACVSPGEKNESYLSNRENDQWESLGTGKQEIPVRKKTVQYDVVVIGAGMGGVPAAVSAARTGAKTLLINDRPVLGGNSSSEIRVTLNGVNQLESTKLPERETGIFEEIQIENRAYNQQESYPVWDHVLYDYVTREPNLTVMLNTQAIDAIMDGDDKIKAARCWQSTTEMEYIVEAPLFLDCSGDGLMAAKAGALYRTGREGKAEYDEKYAPDEADGWQMGSSILMQAKDMGRPMPYKAPSFTIPFKHEEREGKERRIKQYVDGFWWVELGSEYDIIEDQETNRHKLMGYLHGVWDYVKNSGEHPESANYALTWVGSFPGRRESRRFIGDYVLSEKDLTEYRHFEDAIGYGGWSLDEHNPGGIERIDLPPSYFHQKFKKMYEVPFRCLYSKNISNLMFAGRNASLTHIALSSTRIQGTCALMGQAIGTAAAMCVEKGILPREFAQKHIKELQEQLMRDDVYIPNVKANDAKDLAKKASTIFASSTKTGDVNLLTNGVSRDILYRNEINHWQSESLPAQLQMEWEAPIDLSKIEIKCDTNLQRKIMMRKQPTLKHHTTQIPPELLKTLDAEVRVDGKWVKVGEKEDNLRRLIKFHFDSKKVTAIRINMKETYGHDTAKLFEVRCYS